MSQYNTIWEINGASFELDLSDADTLERYEDCLAKLADAEKNIKKDGRQSEFIRSFCKFLADFFDGVFGEGAAEKIFSGQKTSIPVYLETYDNFLAFARNQTAETTKLYSQYVPNRQQRRAAAKKKK